MLDDYFSLEISGDGRLVSLPMVFDDHVPSFDALPVCSKKRGIQRGTKSVSKILFQILDQISYITFCRVYNEFFVIATQRFHPQIETHDFELRLISILNFDKNGLVVANFTVAAVRQPPLSPLYPLENTSQFLKLSILLQSNHTSSMFIFIVKQAYFPHLRVNIPCLKLCGLPLYQGPLSLSSQPPHSMRLSYMEVPNHS